MSHSFLRRAPAAVLFAAIALVACNDQSPTSAPLVPAPLLAKGGGGKPTTPTVQNIAYSAYDGSVYGLRSVAPDGTDLVALPNGMHGIDPAWSADRKKVAFATSPMGNAGLYVMGADGSGLTRLRASESRFPRWSPDGKKIAFVTEVAPTQWAIAVIGTNGKGFTQLTTASPMQDLQPTWSPDGQRIAFHSTRSGTGEIWVMNANGSSPQKITDCLGLGVGCTSPAWSPAAGDDRIALNMNTGSGPSIAVVRATGAWVTQILAGMPHQTELQPAWSPDATQFAFVSRMNGTARPELYAVNVNGTNLRRLTYTVEGEYLPAWSR